MEGWKEEEEEVVEEMEEGGWGGVRCELNQVRVYKSLSLYGL